jgi:hypothetical protein
VYFSSEAIPAQLAIEPMDVVAFVGLAPRGPALERMSDPTLDDDDASRLRARSVPIPVDSWEDYVDLFGGFEGPGLLPGAVSSFFAQGGRRAYVVRVVATQRGSSPADGPTGCAIFDFASADAPSWSPGLRIRSRNEGTWGNRLSAHIRFNTRPLAATALSATELRLAPGSLIAPGSTLRITHPRQSTSFGVVARLVRVGRPGDGGQDVVAVLDRLTSVDADSLFEVVELSLDVTDRDPTRPRVEQFVACGLNQLHPRSVFDVVASESRLAEFLDHSTELLLADPELPDRHARLVTTGEDRWHLVSLDDLFGYPYELPGTGGVDSLGGAPEVATVVVPDLYAPGFVPAVPPSTPAPPARPRFQVCAPRVPVEPQGEPPAPASKLRLDSADPAELRQIIAQQQRLVSTAEALQLVALLDVPPGLQPHQVLRWRSYFDSSYAAAYHPWLLTTDKRNSLVPLPPSAAAAGILARRELRDGISRGAANEVAAGVVQVADQVDVQRHGELHRLGVNVYLLDPDGVRLTAARTLSLDEQWRQLSVRRLLTMIERAVYRQLQWAVFEPSDEALREGLRLQLDALLGALFDLGCFAGATPEESWFVRVAAGADLRAEADRGVLVAEVGVAPSAPLEFIVVRAAIQAEGTIKTTVTGPEVMSHG